MIEHTGLYITDYVEELDKLIDEERFDTRDVGDPQSWAMESHKAAVEFWIDDGGSVDEAYFKRALPVMDERLALAGVRLAALLNQALGN
jgi:hypothetical protein